MYKLGSINLNSELNIQTKWKVHLANQLMPHLPQEMGDCVPPQWSQHELTRSEVTKWWQHFFDENQIRSSPLPLMLYLNVPFCRTHCGFCHFETLVPGKKTNIVDNFVNQVISEARNYYKKFGRMRVQSMAIGGGTPSYLSEKQLSKISNTLFKKYYQLANDGYFNAEFNPDSATHGKLKILVDNGLRRFSIGIQSFNAKTLSSIHRGYQTEKMVFKAAEIAHSFQGLRFVVDILAPMPFETVESFSIGIDKTLQLDPDEIIFYQYQYIDRLKNPTPEGSLDFVLAKKILKQKAASKGLRQVLDTGSSLVYMKKGLTDVGLKYSPNPVSPASIMGLGPFAESYVFSQGHYVSQNDLSLRYPYRGFKADVNMEKSFYITRKFINDSSINKLNYKEVFNSSLAIDFKQEFKIAFESKLLQNSSKEISILTKSRKKRTELSWLFFNDNILEKFLNKVNRKDGSYSSFHYIVTNAKKINAKSFSYLKKIDLGFDYTQCKLFKKRNILGDPNRSMIESYGVSIRLDKEIYLFQNKKNLTKKMNLLLDKFSIEVLPKQVSRICENLTNMYFDQKINFVILELSHKQLNLRVISKKLFNKQDTIILLHVITSFTNSILAKSQVLELSFSSHNNINIYQYKKKPQVKICHEQQQGLATAFTNNILWQKFDVATKQKHFVLNYEKPINMNQHYKSHKKKYRNYELLSLSLSFENQRDFDNNIIFRQQSVYKLSNSKIKKTIQSKIS